MAYRHEVIDSYGELFMSHSRVAPAQSGLIVVEEIARTNPRVLEAVHSSSIVVPPRAYYERSSETSVQTLDTIDCEDLGQFTDRGASRWLELIPRLGKVGTIRLNLAERLNVTEPTTASGIILPDAPEVEFKGYFAFPDEIEALESMAARVRQFINISQPNIGGEQYL